MSSGDVLGLLAEIGISFGGGDAGPEIWFGNDLILKR